MHKLSLIQLCYLLVRKLLPVIAGLCSGCVFVMPQSGKKRLLSIFGEDFLLGGK